MLPKKHRLTYLDFLSNRNPVLRLDLILLVFNFKRSLTSGIRLVIVVPKSLDKRSVRRHMAKRIIIEAARDLIMKHQGNWDVLVKAKKILNNKDRQEVTNEITRFLSGVR